MKGLRIFLIIVLVVICSGALFFAIKGTTDNDNGTTNNSTPSTGTQDGYTSVDIQNAYADGYADAGTDNVQLREDIVNLNSQLETSNNEIATLEASVTEHLATISDLNAQVMTLTTEKVDLENQYANFTSQISGLQAEIDELNSTIVFYEQYVSDIIPESQALITFEYAGSVSDVKVVSIGDHITAPTPQSSDYITFNGWLLNDESVDFDTFTVSESVRIVADVTYSYLVKFNVGETTKSSQIIASGGFATKPNSPSQWGYAFKYWTLDGKTEVDVTQYMITEPTTFIAKYNPLYDVNFEVNGEIIASRRKEAGQGFDAPDVTVPSGMAFVGWQLNGEIVDVEHFTITGDVTFVAKLVGEMEGHFRLIYYVSSYEGSVYDFVYMPTGAFVSYGYECYTPLNPIPVTMEEVDYTSEYTSDFQTAVGVAFAYGTVTKVYNITATENGATLGYDWQIFYFEVSPEYASDERFVGCNGWYLCDGNIRYKMTKVG